MEHMATFTLVSLAGIAVLALVVVAWRLVSNRQSLPCPVWLGWMVEMDNPFTRANRSRAIIDHLDLEPGMDVADIGCGPGRLTLPLARRVGTRGTVVALDAQQGMLARVCEKARAAGAENITLEHAKVGDAALPRDHFDRALLVTVLGEIPDRPAAMRVAFDALKPGGRLAVTEVIFDPHFQPQSRVKRLATDAGFRKQAVYGSRFAYTMVLEKPTPPA